jgi:hypothetical protein
MKVLMTIPVLLALSACGNTLASCEDANKMLNSAQLASIAADANAKINPQSSNMQKLAEYAAVALAVATANQASACAGPL